jgi:hypothetical protein
MKTKKRETAKQWYDRQVSVGRIVADGDCMVWQGGINKSGQPYTRIDNKNVKVRQYVYEKIMRQRRTPGLFLMVTCMNKCCLCHLEEVTRKVLNQRIAKSGVRNNLAATISIRKVKRDGSGVIKSMDHAREIRALKAAGMTYRELEAKTGIKFATLASVVSGRRWRESLPGSSVFSRS